jgi:hypothetical protein
MKEFETYPIVKQYIEGKGLTYKGICNAKKKRADKFNGTIEPLGAEIPVPTGFKEKTYIDNMGEDLEQAYRLWVECKGDDAKLSKIIEGFGRIVYAVFYGGGDGLLAVPHGRIKIINDNKEYFERFAHSVVGKGRVGILDVETGDSWFYN